MKVLEINTNSFSRHGITMHFLNYYSHIDAYQVQADFIANGKVDESLVKKFENLGFRVYKVENRDSNVISYAIALYKIIKQEKYDIVRVHGSSAKMSIEMLVAWLAHVKIRILHSHNTMTNHPIVHKILRPLMCALGNTYFACGDAAGKFLFGKRPFDVIPNGINVDTYKFNETTRNKIRTELGFNGKTVIGHIGNIVQVKNHPFMLKIMAELVKINSNYLLVCVGWGDSSYLEKMCVKLQIEDNVVFLGEKNNVNEILQGFDIMILPSFNEGLPVVVVEGQASGLPFIISDTVTREVAFSDNITYMNIDNNELEWVREIERLTHDTKRNRYDGSKAVRMNGYDIRDDAKELVNKFECLTKK